MPRRILGTWGMEQMNVYVNLTLADYNYNVAKLAFSRNIPSMY